MQDEERQPDLTGAGDGEVEEKVREMMEPSLDPPTPKKVDIQSDEAATAPEVVDMPVPKEPLKIKILHDESDEPEPPKKSKSAAKPKPAAKKSIAVTDDSTDLQAEVEPEEIPVDDEPASDSETEESADESDQVEQAEESDAEVHIAEEDTPEDTEPEEETPESAEDSEPEELPEETPAETAPEMDDAQTVEAVDDIVATDSDKLLEAEDEKIAQAFVPPKAPSIGHKVKSALAAWWDNPKARWLTLSVLFIAFLAAGIFPSSRYFMLNTARVRSGLSVQVLDNSTQQPLKNVKVSVGGASALTDTEGRAKLTKVKLGASDLVIEKRAFAPLNKKITVGFGSNPLGEFRLTPTGARYSFLVTDYLSGKGVEDVEATYRDASAVSDKDGKIKLTIDQPEDELEITLKGKQLREEKLKLSSSTKDEQSIKVVPARKQVFISKRSGKFDVYKIDIDGKNEEKVLAGSGTERDDLTLISHPADEVAALVSTRGNKRNKDGFLLSDLVLIELNGNKTTPVTQSEQIRILDWVGDRLVYVQIAQGTSGGNPKRHRLISYDYKTGDSKELAASNYFNDAMVIGSLVYFAPSSAYQAGNGGFFKIEANGNNKQTILSQEVWNLFRTSYDHLAVSGDKQWFDYKLGDKAPTKLPGAPANLKSRVYIASADAKNSLWIDNRDGKGVLLDFEPATQNEKILRSQSGLKTPVRWLNDSTVVYRINTEQETADYALSLHGGEPKKIRDVSNTSAVDAWYYY